MHPDFAKKLGGLSELVEQGKLPKSAIPRLVYCGHKLLYTIWSPISTMFCVTCQYEWTINFDEENKTWGDQACPKCNSENDVYDVTDSFNNVKWRCRFCKHEWISGDGYTCPSCKVTVDNCGNKIE